MRDDYQEALNALHFSPEAKQRMVRKLTGQPKRNRMRLFAGATAAAALAFAVGGGAYATGLIGGKPPTAPDPEPVVSRTQVVDKVGRPENASATSNGVTITAEAFIGDRTGYAAVFKIAKDDGTPFEGIETNEDGTLRLKFKNLAAVTVEGIYTGSNRTYFFDADTTDNAIQFVKMSELAPPDIGSFRGKTIDVRLTDLKTIDTDDTEHALIEGTWEMKFTANFSDLTLDLPSGQTFEYGEGTATIEALTISPLSMQLDLTLDYVLSKITSEAAMELRIRDSDDLNNLPFLVNLKNGSEVKSVTKSVGITPENDSTKCSLEMQFDTIVNLDDVASITVADVVIPLN